MIIDILLSVESYLIKSADLVNNVFLLVTTQRPTIIYFDQNFYCDKKNSF